MRRIVTAFTLALILGIAQGKGPPGNAAEARHADFQGSGQESANDEWRGETCRYATRDGSYGFSVGEVRATLRCAAEHFGPPLDLAEDIVGCESGFDAEAQNPNSSAGGVWQVLDSTWESWKSRYREFMARWDLRPDKHNGRVNALLGYRVLASSGPGPWSASAGCWG